MGERQPSFNSAPKPHVHEEEHETSSTREAEQIIAARLEDAGVVDYVVTKHESPFVEELFYGGSFRRRSEKHLAPAREFLKKAKEKRPIPEVQRELQKTVVKEGLRIEVLASKHDSELRQLARTFSRFQLTQEHVRNAYQGDLIRFAELEKVAERYQPSSWAPDEMKKEYEQLRGAVSALGTSLQALDYLQSQTYLSAQHLEEFKEERALLVGQSSSLEKLSTLLASVPRKQRFPMKEYVQAIREANPPLPEAILAHLETAFQWEFGKKAFTMHNAKESLASVVDKKIKFKDQATGDRYIQDLEMYKVPNESYEITHGRRQQLEKKIDWLRQGYDYMIEAYDSAIEETEEALKKR